MSTPDSPAIGPALNALRAGLPVLVADAADRENEVDAIFAADRASAKWVAWVVRHSSGYLCAPLPAARAELVHDSGEVMRYPEAAALAEREGLPLITIAELRAYRRSHERTVA